MSYMFSGCYNLKELDVSSFDTSNVRAADECFDCCTSLINVYVGDKWKKIGNYLGCPLFAGESTTYPLPSQNRKNISEAKLEYTQDGRSAEITVRYNGRILTHGVDYLVSQVSDNAEYDMKYLPGTTDTVTGLPETDIVGNGKKYTACYCR